VVVGDAIEPPRVQVQQRLEDRAADRKAGDEDLLIVV
jgi:hypothetical protein